MYSVVDPNFDAHGVAFCTEAESIWKTESENDSIPNLIASLFLSLGYLGQGRDHAVLQYISQATKMAVRLGLFGVENNGQAKIKVDKMTAEAASAYLHAAWGSFNWIRYVHSPNPPLSQAEMDQDYSLKDVLSSPVHIVSCRSFIVSQG